jgi:hypothetical protein
MLDRLKMKLSQIFGRRKKPFEVEADRIYREKIGKLRVEHGDGFDLVQFGGDYETYRKVQVLANKAKIDWRSVSQDEIDFVCHTLTTAGVDIRAVLCHGTRNGAEQSFFRNRLPDAEILGTEISETAAQFPMTIQWDFHEVKPEWREHFDVIFSNSWDHTYDPHKLFPAWLSCVRANGAMVLEWSNVHVETPADMVDPFRASLEGLTGLINQHGRSLGFAPATIVAGSADNKRAKRYVLARRAAG